MSQLTLPVLEGQRDINALLVNAQTDRQRARFAHGQLQNLVAAR
ncbi:hypothetical protein [Ideonella paludis]|nr:hypothetical protein [Ideonella paludis]